MRRQTFWRALLAVIVFFLSGLVLSGCGDTKNEGTETGVDSRPAAPSSSREAPRDLSHEQGEVLAGRELGLVVTGSGAASKTRSLDVLEHQLLSFLPQLQAVYDRERVEDPGLMGSLDVQITVEPNGAVSDLRFPIQRVSSEKLTTAVYDLMRGWVFFPAESAVEVRYRLLFVPPGLEASSIVAWEKQLATRVVLERHEGNTPPPPPSPPAATEVVAEEPPPPITEKIPPAKNPVPSAPPREPQAVVSAKEPPVERSKQGLPEPPPVREKKRSAKLPTWYEVTRPSVLYTAPDVAAEIVTRLPPGKRVWVVRVVNGDWLEVRSVGGRPPGFLPRETARPERRERAAR